ncbi:MAG: hypothetical protein HFH72_08255 [Lachnospiraceae bacterium]|nr:hypothetical protein [Lachnospiraceae bacterium]
MRKGNMLAIGVLAGGIFGVMIDKLLTKSAVKGKQVTTKDKFKIYYNTLNQWLVLKQKNKNLSEYFMRKNYKRIAVYGLGEMGNRLIDELLDTTIEVVYGVDKNINHTFCSMTVYALEDIGNASKEIDAIVVTPVFAFDEIVDSLKEKVDCDIVSLEDVVFEM